MDTAIQEQEVTPLELFFDLVFVFAITQVSGFVSDDATWTHLLEGLAILAVLWWAWVSYAWLGNTAASDDGAIRVVLLTAMGAMLIVSLAVPGAFGDDGLMFGVAYLAVRLLHLGAYAIISRDDEELQGVVGRLATTAVPGAALLVVAGALDGTAQAVCWIAALAVDYGGLAVRASSRARCSGSPPRPRCGGRTSTSSRSWPSAGCGRRRTTSRCALRATPTPTCISRWSWGS